MMESLQSIDARLAALLAAPVSTRVHLMGINGAGLSAIVTGRNRRSSRS